MNVAYARSCLIADPDDTALNVRDSPNGKVINRLRNGRTVEIERLRNDTKGRSWGYATGQFKGKFRQWGWVFMQAVDCGGKTRPAEKTRSAKGEFDRQVNEFWQADKILKARGFTASARLSVLNGGIRRLDTIFTGKVDPLKGPSRAGILKSSRWANTYTKLQAEFAARYGGKSGVMADSDFAPNTGRPIHHKSFVTMAKRVPGCFARNTPWKSCKLNYHPVEGCFLTAKQRKECRRIGGLWEKKQKTGSNAVHRGTDAIKCWSYEKGPGIILPWQTGAKSQIKLAKAAKKKTSKRKKKNANPRNRAICQLWWD